MAEVGAPEPLEDEDILEETLDDNIEGTSRRRTVIIAIIILAVLIIVSVLFFLRVLGDDNSESTVLTNQEQTATISPTIPNNNRKNRNKKVKYAKLYQQLDGEQLADVIRELTFNEIRYDFEQRGKFFDLLVEKDYLEDAKILLARKGVPTGSAKGFAIFDEAQTVGVTEFDKRIRFMRALSGELENALVRLDGIVDSKVQIVMPERRLFSVAQHPVTASILIRKANGYVITDDLVFSIIELTSSAVEGLLPQNVSVIDTQGRVLSTGVWERMWAKYNDKQESSESQSKPQAVPAAAFIAPTEENVVQPTQNAVKNWVQAKRTIEKRLETKAIGQLSSIIPRNGFNLAINVELVGPSIGQEFRINRITTSIVADQTKIQLNKLLKKEIFSTVASAIGYVKGRDIIQLNKGHVNHISLVTLTAKPDSNVVSQSVVVSDVKPVEDKPSFFAGIVGMLSFQKWIDIVMDYWFVTFGIGLFIVAGVVLKRARSKRSFLEEAQLSDLPSDTDSKKTGDVHEELLKKVNDVDVESLAKVLESWCQVTGEQQEEVKEQQSA
ncbi:MAG: hypothetical protein HRT90_06715 [Candidatus Margulisbacteria bacterium]|nr:hypothetical protein [Candidatus Margulisiibacteriota bacterium]